MNGWLVGWLLGWFVDGRGWMDGWMDEWQDDSGSGTFSGFFTLCPCLGNFSYPAPELFYFYYMHRHTLHSITLFT